MSDVFETDRRRLEAVHRRSWLQEVRCRLLADLMPASDPTAQGMDRRSVQIFTAAYNTRAIKKTTCEELRRSHQSKWKGSSASKAETTIGFPRSSAALASEKGVSCSRDRDKNGLSARKGHTLLANLVVTGEVTVGAYEPISQGDAAKNDGRADRLRRAAARGRTAAGTGMARKAPHPTLRCCSWISSSRTDRDPRQARLHFRPREGQAAAGEHAADIVDPALLLDQNDKWESYTRRPSAHARLRAYGKGTTIG